VHVVPGTGLDELMQQGEFQPLGDDDILAEIKLFIENLDVHGTYLASDHILNLLEELEGTFPEDKKKILSAIDRYFSFSSEDRQIFRLGRRTGALRKIDDLADTETYFKLKAVVDSYAASGGKLDEDIIKMMNNFI